MDYLLVALVALVASGLTFFSGFGLGTLLMPAFALLMPVPAAIAATAVVHLLNNLFKLALVGKSANRDIVLRFGIPAAAAAFAGAGVLVLFTGLPPLTSYDLSGHAINVTPVKLVIGSLIVVFASLELVPTFASFSIPARHLVAGGVVSGFFGGLSGNQGAFRTAVLIKAGLDKRAFVATGVSCAVIVDVARLTVYGLSTPGTGFLDVAGDGLPLVATAVVFAYAGAYAGARMLDKVTLGFVRLVVAISMIAIGIGLASGVV